MQFEISFPLIHRFDRFSEITFGEVDSQELRFPEGMYYLDGENGSGKSTLLSMLALTEGSVGKSARDIEAPGNRKGTIRFGQISYDDSDFNIFEAAKIRERHFCIFPQNMFLFPGLSTWENNELLNGSGGIINFRKDEYPDFLSGGQRQKRLMEILLADTNRSVWFFDEPFTHLYRNTKEWILHRLKDGYYRPPKKIVFFIDHALGKEAEEDNGSLYILYGEIPSFIKTRSSVVRFVIKIYRIQDPTGFFDLIKGKRS